eukprot:14388256-Alexandrium_andersonii.AAC.1
MPPAYLVVCYRRGGWLVVVGYCCGTQAVLAVVGCWWLAYAVGARSRACRCRLSVATGRSAWVLLLVRVHVARVA